MQAIAPVLDPLAEAARRAWDRVKLACFRWARREMSPMHADRHWVELQIQLLERRL
jgi:hypothetical protein